MYRSPIEIIQGQIEMQLEGEVMRAVQKVGVNVDKEELIRALQYDREQYYKGRLDAMEDIIRCHECDNSCPGSRGLVCTVWGACTEPGGWCHNGERRTEDGIAKD